MGLGLQALLAPAVTAEARRRHEAVADELMQLIEDGGGA